MNLNERACLRAMPAPLVAVLVAVLAGAVAAASRGGALWQPLQPGRAEHLSVVAAVTFLALLVMIAALGALLIRRALAGSPTATVSLRLTLLRPAPALVAAFVALALVVIAGIDSARVAPADGPRSTVELAGERIAGLWGITDHRDTPIVAGEGTEAESVGPPAPEPATPPLLRLVLIAAVTMALVLAFTAWRAARRRAAGGLAAPTGRAAAHGAVVGSIDAMLADADPNTAIIGAYARLLEGLDACGFGRREHEAPLEHLQRTLAVLEVQPRPLRQLLGLFEVARFSTARLTAKHREEALAALRAVAADLVSVRPAAAAAPGAATTPRLGTGR